MMDGNGEPKEKQSSKAGLLVMTRYTWLGGVSTLGGSAIGKKRNHANLIHGNL